MTSEHWDQVEWFSDYLFLEETVTAAFALSELEYSRWQWIVIGNRELKQFTALEAREARLLLDALTVEERAAESVSSALQLATQSRTLVVSSRDRLPEINEPVQTAFSSFAPYIMIDDHGRFSIGTRHENSRAHSSTGGQGPVGSPDEGASETTDNPPVSVPEEGSQPGSRSGTVKWFDTEKRFGYVKREDGKDVFVEVSDITGDYRHALDEGSKPVRYPDIAAMGSLRPGKYVEIVVNALLEKSAHTTGSALSLETNDDKWESLELIVHVSCPLIEFDERGQGTVTVFRNKSSLSASFHGLVSEHAKDGEAVSIDAAFFHGNRFCGTAQRDVVIGAEADADSDSGVAGILGIEVAADQPDITVYISRDTTSANQLHWHVVTTRFDGLPPRLDGSVTLGFDPAAQTEELFGSYARLKAGEHVRAIHGFGAKLWDLAPGFFHQVYWAMHKKYDRTLSIQLVTDDPYIPWELMRPVNHDESIIHAPLAVTHRVGRWLRNWDGLMPATIGAGSLYTIAPNYPTASARLPRALAESQALVDNYQAHALQGTRKDVIGMLEDKTTTDPVAMLHFAGHGTFDADAASESAIKLEDGSLTASEVGLPEVTLGKRCRTLVFLNACEVGAAGDVLGDVGGWADVFLKRHFGGFIAPLWAVEDQDASIVAQELVKGVLVNHEPIGEVMRRIRETYGEEAPTFYSYLYYGDVTARVEA